MTNMVIVCTHCQSINVLRDAYACWNFASQDWELSSVYDDLTCGDCGESTRGEEVTVPQELGTDEDRIQKYIRSRYIEDEEV